MRVVVFFKWGHMRSIRAAFLREYKHKIVRDIILLIVLFAFFFFLYVEVKQPFPIRFLFRSTLQNIRTTVLEEYIKIYYPVYYFSKQTSSVAKVIDAPLVYRDLISNFFTNYTFIESSKIKINDFIYYIDKSSKNSNNYIIQDMSNFENILARQIIDDKLSYIDYDKLTVDSFYTKNNGLYIKLLYISDEEIAYSYDVKFNVPNYALNKDVDIKDMYAYLSSGDNIIVFPISDLNQEIPLRYAKAIQKFKNIESKDTNMLKIKSDGVSYWGYKSTFLIEDDISEVGIVVPEDALINKIRVPIVLFFIFTITLSIMIMVFLSLRYLKFLDTIRKNHKDIKLLIQEGENTHVEFKATLRYDIATEILNKNLENVIMKSIAAFSNTEGGRLVIGVKNDGEIIGLENDYSTLKHGNNDFFELHLRTVVEATYGNAFSSERIRVDFIKKGDKEVCIVNVKQGREPLYTKITNKQGLQEEKFYIRVGNSSREITHVSEMMSYIKKHFK